MPKWQAIKGRNKALSNGAFFRPDIAPVITGYDQTLKTYDDLQDQKKKLKASLADVMKFSAEYGTKIGAHKEELEKITAKDEESIVKANTELKKYAADADADIGAITTTLSNFAAAGDDLTTMRKALWDKITNLAQQKVQAYNKARDDFKSKGDAITNGEKKAQTDADKFEGQIRQIINNYAKLAVQMDHDDIESDVRTLLDSF
jgi:chromosome segregation ATPase